MAGVPVWSHDGHGERGRLQGARQGRGRTEWPREETVRSDDQNSPDGGSSALNGTIGVHLGQ
jgi:hypothetical protein